MAKLADEQIERQDFVDNAIFELIQNLNPTDKEIGWNIDFIGDIRDLIESRFVEMGICSEKEFYPYIDD